MIITNAVKWFVFENLFNRWTLKRQLDTMVTTVRWRLKWIWVQIQTYSFETQFIIWDIRATVPTLPRDKNNLINIEVLEKYLIHIRQSINHGNEENDDEGSISDYAFISTKWNSPICAWTSILHGVFLQG